MPSVYPFNSALSKYIYQWGDTIGIYPTPTEIKVIRIHYVYKPDALQGTALTTVPAILSKNDKGEFADAMVLYATAQIMRRLNPEVYQMLKAEFVVEKDRAISGSKIFNEEVIQSPHKDI